MTTFRVLSPISTHLRQPHRLLRRGCKCGRRVQGFTLLELLAVLAIIAVLTTAVIGAGRFAAESSRIARAHGEIAALGAALDSYRAHFGDYPRTDDPSLLAQALIGRRDPALQPATARPFFDAQRFTFLHGSDPYTNEHAQLLDPWERPYRYSYRPAALAATWANHAYVLYSMGPDGVDAGALSREGFSQPTRPENLDNVFAGGAP